MCHTLIMDFIEERNLFFKNNNVDLLIEQLEALDKAGTKFGHFTAYGCEFVLNGTETGSQWYNIGDFLEERYGNVQGHAFELVRCWDSFVFYNPSDFRGLIFDFGYIREGKILTYNGLTNMFNHEIIKEFTIDEFLTEYGMKKFYSCTHYRVSWPSLGFSWNN